jgi:hypothetical protein
MRVTNGSLLDRMLEVPEYVYRRMLMLCSCSVGLDNFCFWVRVQLVLSTLSLMLLQAVAACTKLTWLQLATPTKSGTEVSIHATLEVPLLVQIADTCPLMAISS